MSANEDRTGLAVYATIWRVVCGLIGVVSGVVAGLVLPTEAFVPIILLLVVAGATAAIGYEEDGAHHWTRLRTVGTALAASGAAVVVIGLTATFGPGVLALALVLAAASPPAVRWYVARLGSAPAVDVPGVAQSAELCRAWHDSFKELQQARTPAERMRVVEQRQQYLDELERLDPEGLQAWLESAASAAGDPGQFIKNQ
ncbi:MAG: hypothetical protein HOV67_18655 [Kribbellaceae bacterium]|nr:hypothetical protein [Kribbellaceae bacterium]